MSLPPSSLVIPSDVRRVGISYYFNSRSNSEVNRVCEPVGKDYIISEFEKVLEYSEMMAEVDPTFLYFQICLSAKSTKDDPKPVKGVNAKTWGSKYAANAQGAYDGLTWHTVYTTVETLYNLICRGFIIRLGIKDEGNKKHNFIGAYGVALDLDNDSSVDYVQTLDILIAHSINPFVIHYSPSGNENNNKLRAIILFDEIVTDYDKLTQFIKGLNHVLPNAASHVHDPGRLFYTTLLGVPYSCLDLFNNFDSLYQNLDSIGAIPKIETPLESSSDSVKIQSNITRDTVNKQFVDYINTEILTEGQSIFDLIPQWVEHHGMTLENWHLHDSPGDNIEQWRGLDPINPDESTTGTSFTVYHASDNTYGYNSGRSGISGDMPDLWFRLSNQSWKVNEGIKDKSLWWNAIREICEYHKVPDFSVLYERTQITSRGNLESCLDMKKLDKGVIALVPHLVWKLFLEQHEDLFYFQSSSSKYWLYIDNVWRCLNKAQFLSEFRSFLCDYKSVLGVPVDSLITSSFITGLVTCITMTPKSNSVYKFDPDYEYVPCKNGAYSLKNHELIEYSPKIRNTMKLKLDYKPSTGKGLEAFRNFLSYIVVDPDCIEDVLKWIAATVQYKGFYTRKALALVGDPNSGKSLLTNLIKEMVMSSTEEFYHVLAKELKAGTLLDEGARFSTLQLEGIVLGVITEFNGLPKRSDGSLLKDLIANPTDDIRGVSVSVEYKGGDHTDIKVRAAILTNGQNFPKLPANDNGWDRRFMPVQVKHNPVRNDKIFSDPVDYLEDFFSWCLEQDVDQIIDHFLAIAKNRDHTNDHWIAKAMREMKKANNRYWRFAEEVLVHSPGSKIVSNQVFLQYKQWCYDTEERPNTKSVFDANMPSVLSDLFNMPISDTIVQEQNGIWYLNNVQINPNAL